MLPNARNSFQQDTPLSASLRIVRMYLDLDCTNPERRVHPANLTWTSPSQNLPSKQFRLVWSCDNLRLHHNFVLCETNMLKHHACWSKFHIDVRPSQGPTIPDNPVNPKPDWTQVLISLRHLVDTVPILTRHCAAQKASMIISYPMAAHCLQLCKIYPPKM